MEFPLSKREKRLYYEVKKRLQSDEPWNEYEYQKYIEWLSPLEEKCVISVVKFDGGYLCTAVNTYKDFENEIKDYDRKAKRMTRREVIIAIVSAIVAGLFGLLPYICSIIYGG